MSLQWRNIVDGTPGKWNDHESEILRIAPKGLLFVEIREKPSFEPGYYRQITLGGNAKGFVQWWTHEPDLDLWERVEVTKVDA